MSGRGVVRSWRTKYTPATRLTAKMARVAGAVKPHEGARLRPSRPAVTAPERAADPIQSSWRQGLTGEWPARSVGEEAAGGAAGTRPPPSRSAAIGSGASASDAGSAERSWAGRTMTASTAAMAIRGSSPQKRGRHPKYWMIGAPMVNTRTAPPAPTRAHQPIALTRSSWEKAWRTRAIDAAPVAAPCTPSNRRAAMSTPAVGAEAVRTTLTAAPERTAPPNPVKVMFTDTGPASTVHSPHHW